MKKILILICASLLLQGCNNDKTESPITGLVYSFNFISDYIVPEEIILETFKGNFKDRIDVNVSGESFSHAYRCVNGQPRYLFKEYEVLAEKYGDTDLKGYILPYSNSALSMEPDGITVICDKDIDDEHPAGTPLDDIILMHGWTYKEYISSGYTQFTDDVDNDYGYTLMPATFGHTPFFKYLKDINENDLVLLRNKFFLFPPRDLPKGEYNFTVTMFCDEIELTGNVQYIVE